MKQPEQTGQRSREHAENRNFWQPVVEMCGSLRCLSKADLVKHMKSLESNLTTFDSPIPRIECHHGNFSCTHYSSVCRSARRLKYLMKVHSDANSLSLVSTNANAHDCQIWSKMCSLLARLKNYQQAHGRSINEGIAIV